MRQYASSFGLNANDEDHTNITSYWTRVEHVERLPKSEKRWTATLRKVTPLSNGTLEVRWWQEEFDAVVVSLGLDSDGPHVPDIPGLVEWSKVLASGESKRHSVYHSRAYRTPERYTNKVEPLLPRETQRS